MLFGFHRRRPPRIKMMVHIFCILPATSISPFNISPRRNDMRLLDPKRQKHDFKNPIQHWRGWITGTRRSKAAPGTQTRYAGWGRQVKYSMKYGETMGRVAKLEHWPSAENLVIDCGVTLLVLSLVGCIHLLLLSLGIGKYLQSQ